MTTSGLAAEEPDTADFFNQQSYWLSDPQTGCYVFYAGPVTADAVTWSGDCANGAASGGGTATFTNDDRFVESVSGWFRRGKAEGQIRANWADGSRFEGHVAGGRLNGKGVFITADGDRLEGQWTNNRLKKPAVQAAKDASESADKLVAAEPAQTKADKASESTADQPAGSKDVANKTTSDKPTKAETKVAAATAPKRPHTNPPVAAPARLFDAVTGKKLVSLDGSTISLSISDGALIREIASPGTAAQKTRFSFLNEKQGTVSDAKDTKVVGLFRVTESKLEIDYADGHSETLMPNSSGGVSSLLGAPGEGSLCMSWYPEGHQFSTADRQLALALYASRLGLRSPLPVKAAASSTGCATADATPAATPASTSQDAHRGEAPSKPASAASHALHPRRSAAKTAQPNKKVLFAREPARKVAGPVIVQASRVHRIDIEKAAPAVVRSAQARRAADKPAPILPRSSQIHRIDAEKPTPAKVELATARSIASIAPPAQQRASTCLNIESDGADWGFRNHCSFPVQFAYCLMDGGELFASCQKGAVTGSVAPNGFNRLLAARATNAGQHDFRWIACNGDASHVVARLVKPDPPAGQCIPARAS